MTVPKLAHRPSPPIAHTTAPAMQDAAHREHTFLFPAETKPTSSYKNTLAHFDRHAPTNNYRHVYFRGDEMNVRTRELLQRAETIMRKKYSHIGFQFIVTQGSYNVGGVLASLGTHDGGGALDLHTRTHPRHVVDDMVKSLREAGFAAWSRGRGHDTFSPHIHALALGDQQMSSSARRQIIAYARGSDGLIGNNPDADRHLGRPVPAWAKAFVGAVGWSGGLD